MTESRCLTPAEYLALSELATTAIRNGFEVQMIAAGQLLVSFPSGKEKEDAHA